MTRREAAKLIGGTTAGLLLPVSTSPGQMNNESRMLTRSTPSSGEKLPVIGLGTWSVFDVNLTPENRTQLGDVLSLFVKHGSKVIDSSPMYGRAEGVIGELADPAYSFMGGIYSARKVREELAPRIVDELKRAHVDAFYLVPA